MDGYRERYLRLHGQEASDAEGPETVREVTLSLSKGCHVEFPPLRESLMGEGEALEFEVPALVGGRTR